MVSHSSKDWRHCGLCNFEFFSETETTPNHLNLVLYKSDNENNNKDIINDLNGSYPSSNWSLQPELMWRIIVTHETVHLNCLFPKRHVFFIPTQLIEQLIDSNAIQAVMAARWILKKAKKELESSISDDEQIPGVNGPATTQEAFGIGQQKTRYVSIDKNMVDAAVAILNEVMKKEEILYENNVTTKSRTRSNFLSMCSMNFKTTLAASLVKHFNEIGELNALKQIDYDFMDSL